MPSSFTVIAHRGASHVAPENTLRAFEAAAALGCRWIECDVRLSRDGIPVIIHDATTRRTCRVRGRVSRMTFSSLRKLDAGAGERIPSLAETLRFAKRHGVRMVLEIKDPRALIPTLKTLSAAQAADRVIVSSFFASVLRRAKQYAPSLAIAHIMHIPARKVVPTAIRAHASLIHISLRLANKRTINAARMAGLRVWVWTINDKKTAFKLKTRGVDGIFTDNPGLFIGLQ